MSILEKELQRLQRKYSLGLELTVKWLPETKGYSPIDHKEISGQVLGDTIFIYEKEEKKALVTLRHEYLDYTYSSTQKPLLDIINSLLTIIQNQNYKNKEEWIDKISESM